MASAPTMHEQETPATATPRRTLRAKRLFALYGVLALLAVVIGVIVGVQRHDAAAIGNAAAPTEQSVLATAPPGQPTPTPLATKAPAPTTVPPTSPPPATVAQPTPIVPTITANTPVPPPAPAAAPVRSAPVVNQDTQHGNGNANENGKGKGD